VCVPGSDKSHGEYFGSIDMAEPWWVSFLPFPFLSFPFLSSIFEPCNACSLLTAFNAPMSVHVSYARIYIKTYMSVYLSVSQSVCLSLSLCFSLSVCKLIDRPWRSRVRVTVGTLSTFQLAMKKQSIISSFWAGNHLANNEDQIAKFSWATDNRLENVSEDWSIQVLVPVRASVPWYIIHAVQNPQVSHKAETP
jgi:hypothetical protein